MSSQERSERLCIVWEIRECIDPHFETGELEPRFKCTPTMWHHIETTGRIHVHKSTGVSAEEFNFEVSLPRGL